MNMKKGKRYDVLFAVLTVIVIIAFAALFLWNRNTSEKERKELEALAAEYAKTETQVIEAEDGADEESETEEETVQTVYSSISCRGEAFLAYGAEGTTYPEMLAALLEEAGYDVEVSDNTLDMAGSLTQLLYAGVSSELIEEYMSAHQAQADASGETATDTEVETRDLSATVITRDDEDSLPIISIGFRGGWNNDLDELIDQQTALLETYSQQDDFIIIGINGSASVTDEEYDAAMEEAWGDHYLSLNELEAASYTAEVRESIARALFEKLVDLGYIED